MAWLSSHIGKTKEHPKRNIYCTVRVYIYKPVKNKESAIICCRYDKTKRYSASQIVCICIFYSGGRGNHVKNRHGYPNFLTWVLPNNCTINDAVALNRALYSSANRIQRPIYKSYRIYWNEGDASGKRFAYIRLWP